jgi:hypothetical protein
LETLRAAIAKIESVRSGLGAASLKADFLGNQRDVYDAAIALMLDSGSRDPEALFEMFEKARARTLREALGGTSSPPSLKSTQARLAPGTVLLECWDGSRKIVVIAVTP